MKNAEKRIVSLVLAVQLLLGLGGYSAHAVEHSPERPVENGGYELVSPGGTVYYVDGEHGNDDFAGTSPGMAWKTVARVNQMRYAPDDQILFRAGGVWADALAPQGEGDEGYPVVVSAYGEGETPILSQGVALYNTDYWELRGLAITNPGGIGVMAASTQPERPLKRVCIINCTIYDVAQAIETTHVEEVLTQGNALPIEASDDSSKPDTTPALEVPLPEPPMDLATPDGLPTSLSASKDTYIQKDNAGPYGDKNINVKSGSPDGFYRYGLLAFDLIESQQAVAQASRILLRLQVASFDTAQGTGNTSDGVSYGENTQRNLTIYDVGTAWEESVKWNDAPQLSEGTPIVVKDRLILNKDVMANPVLEFDVTDYVRNSGADELGFLLGILTQGGTNLSNCGIVFYPRENATESYRPTLVFQYSTVTSIEAVSVTSPAKEDPALILPEAVTVTYEDGTTAQRKVIWDAVEPESYDTAGKTITIQGAVDGVALRASAVVTVSEALPVVQSVAAQAPISADTGTAQSRLGLPVSVKAVLSTGEEVDAVISKWDAVPSFHPSKGGSYLFTGTIDTTGKDYRNYGRVAPTVAVTLIQRPDKNILTYALIKAQKAQADGSVDELLPSMKTAFGNAVAGADTVYQNREATQKEVQEAYLTLQTALWKLSYVPVDKAALEAALKRAEETDLTPYSESKVQAVRQALETAKEWMAREGLSAGDQPLVDEAVKELIRALDNLNSSSDGGSGGGAARPKPEPPVETKPVETIFEDVSADAWYRDDVQYVVDAGLMQGTDAGFQPDAPMSRAMLMTVLYRMAGAPGDGENSGGVWYGSAMTWATGAGLTDGTSPERNISREQIAVLLYRYMKLPVASGDLSQFPDAGSLSAWAADAMGWAVEIGLFSGKGDGRLDPQGMASRAEVSALLARFARMNKTNEGGLS